MAKQSKKKTSASNTRYFSAYNGDKQRQKRLERHLKRHPNDAQAKKCKPTYRRKAPQNKLGWLTREMANLIYMGFTPGKNDEAAIIVNNMKPSDKKQTAYLASQLKKCRNRLQYQSKEKRDTIKQLGYAG